MMDIWASWAKRKSKCRFCPEPVLPGTRIFRGKIWMKRQTGDEPTPRRFTIKYIWHFACYPREANMWLDAHPYESVSHKPGRRVVAKPELQEERVKLLKRHATLAHRQRSAALAGNVEKVVELEFKKQDLITQVAATGPVPTRWIPK